MASTAKPSHNANGNSLSTDGLLITCEHSSRRVTRTEKDGTVTVLADSYDGKKPVRLDLVLHGRGGTGTGHGGRGQGGTGLSVSSGGAGGPKRALAPSGRTSGSMAEASSESIGAASRVSRSTGRAQRTATALWIAHHSGIAP